MSKVDYNELITEIEEDHGKVEIHKDYGDFWKVTLKKDDGNYEGTGLSLVHAYQEAVLATRGMEI